MLFPRLIPELVSLRLLPFFTGDKEICRTKQMNTDGGSDTVAMNTKLDQIFRSENDTNSNRTPIPQSCCKLSPFVLRILYVKSALRQCSYFFRRHARGELFIPTLIVHHPIIWLNVNHSSLTHRIMNGHANNGEGASETGALTGTMRVKAGLAQMLKGGVIMGTYPVAERYLWFLDVGDEVTCRGFAPPKSISRCEHMLSGSGSPKSVSGCEQM